MDLRFDHTRFSPKSDSSEAILNVNLEAPRALITLNSGYPTAQVRPLTTQNMPKNNLISGPLALKTGPKWPINLSRAPGPTPSK